MKSNLFTDLLEGFDALAQQREGKVALQTFKVRSKPTPRLDRQDVVELCTASENLAEALPAALQNIRTSKHLIHQLPRRES
jgi:putative transcriptional regulator